MSGAEQHASGSMSNKKARCDPIDFHVRLRWEEGIDLKLPRSTPLTADQRPRVLSVRVLGDTVPDEFFKGCHALTEADLGTELVRLGDSAFQGCVRLKAVCLPDTVTEVGPHAFFVCRGLESACLSARGMRRNPSGMIACCPELRRVIFPDDLEKIGECAFDRADMVCGRLPVTLRRVGECAFSVHADLADMFPHVKLRQSVPPFHNTAVISAASVEGMHTETPLLRLKIRALGKGAETVYGVSCYVGTGVCVSGCILDDREKEPEA
jgi:hypothetical protein